MTNTATQRILLAEDDDAMRVYLERALVNAGYKVDSVDRGTAAVPLLVESDYDLLLSISSCRKWTASNLPRNAMR